MSEIFYPVKRVFRVNCRVAARGGFLQVKKPPAKDTGQPLKNGIQQQNLTAETGDQVLENTVYTRRFFSDRCPARKSSRFCAATSFNRVNASLVNEAVCGVSTAFGQPANGESVQGSLS